MVSPHYLRTVYHISFIFHIRISPGEGLTPIDFVFFMSRVKVTRVTFVRNGFLEKFLSQSFHNVIALSTGETLLILGSLGQRSKSQMGTFEK